ncbi:cation efflux family-domain-containing protein [Podospora fimiseda]|uniref:Cation efflux family-domain-containing protein n=1 Tax=Podospora fimiseda TaxID=252190 RepID=A0AAN7H6R8_9PEZI|nr:cation efflux family-domain-containing protein [Podospora fimiseda]
MSRPFQATPPSPSRSQVPSLRSTFQWRRPIRQTFLEHQTKQTADAAQDIITTVNPSPSDNASSSSTAKEIDVSPPTRQPTMDPLDFERHKHSNPTMKQMKNDHPNGNKRKLKKYYTKQNELIDQFLGVDDEERNAVEADAKYQPKIKFAIRASFVVNLSLFIIQLYAAISTGSLVLFATTADAFMDLVSSFVMLVTSILAARPSVYKYPVGRKRIEAIGIILFCALMTTVAVQLLIEGARSLGSGGRGEEAEELHLIPIIFVAVAIGAKGSMMVYCLLYRRFPTVHIFYIDHRNDIFINTFGLVMAIVGAKIVWYLDPIGAIIIAVVILYSWSSNAFEQVWLLVGKSAPKEYIAKLIYMGVTHDERILKVDTCRAYHAGHNYYVEMDIVLDENLPLRITHDIGQSLQRKIEGLADVERAFVHVDYEHHHDINEEHKPLHAPKDKTKRTLKEILLFRKPAMQAAEAAVDGDGTATPPAAATAEAKK